MLPLPFYNLQTTSSSLAIIIENQHSDNKLNNKRFIIDTLKTNFTILLPFYH